MTPAKIRVACIVGTRPEVIKMAPVIQKLYCDSRFLVEIISTAQHRQLLDEMMDIFSLKADIDLNIMRENQTLSALTGHLFIELGKIFNERNYQLVLGQGDTTTTWVAAQTAFYNKIPFGHIEAGLRSFDMLHPFPEELDRVFVAKMATWHFAPTEEEKENLVKEGVNAKNIFVTGNTVIDALKSVAARNIQLPFQLDPNKKVILLTLHRRESFGAHDEHIFQAFIDLTQRFSDIQIVYPVHPNPNVHNLAYQMLDHVENIHLIEPLPYDEFVTLLKQSYFVMTDSGGIQEEAPALDKPVLILRDVTERPLIVELGMAQLVGTERKGIVDAASELLSNPVLYKSMQKHLSPYGDGKASDRIVDIINSHLDMQGKIK